MKQTSLRIHASGMEKSSADFLSINLTSKLSDSCVQYGKTSSSNFYLFCQIYFFIGMNCYSYAYSFTKIKADFVFG